MPEPAFLNQVQEAGIVCFMGGGIVICAANVHVQCRIAELAPQPLGIRADIKG